MFSSACLRSSLAIQLVIRPTITSWSVSGRELRRFSPAINIVLGLSLLIEISWSELGRRIMFQTIAAYILLELCCTSVLATIVEESDPNIHWDDTWLLDVNTGLSGGFARRTNITGGKATYSFTGESTLPPSHISYAQRKRTSYRQPRCSPLGTVVNLYGVAHIDGANFSFAVDNVEPKNCTCWINDNTWRYKRPLCDLSGLDGTLNHTLTVTHTDVSGLWLNFDFLE